VVKHGGQVALVDRLLAGLAEIEVAELARVGLATHPFADDSS
jgi:hypothetical protein